MMLEAYPPLCAGRTYRIQEGIAYPVPWSALRTRIVFVLNVVSCTRLSALYAVSYSEAGARGHPRKPVHGAISQGLGKGDGYRVVAVEEVIPVKLIEKGS